MQHFNEIYIEGLRAIPSGPYHKKQKIVIAPGMINVLIGVNGSGKSTVLDSIHALCDEKKLCTLQTENSLTEAVSRLEFRRGNDLLQISFTQHNDYLQYQQISVANNGKTLMPVTQIPKFWRSDANLANVMSNLAQYAQGIVYIETTASPINGEAFASELCELGNLLEGCAPQAEDAVQRAKFNDAVTRPIRFDGAKDVYRIYLQSDLIQPSLVPFWQLPSGWRRYGVICEAVASASPGSVILLDEPEIHLHPKIQHRLMQRIFELAKAKSLQVFIATHSNVFINSQRWMGGDAKIFWARDQEIKAVNPSPELLDRLGFKASDFLQTDGVIWVEGPSDRLYIEHWLDLWCAKNKLDRPAENANYSYSFYGGAILSHFQADEGADLIDLLKINTNAFIVIDNDNDFSFSNTGEPVARRKNSTKQRVLQSVKAGGGSGWVTKGYTVESYLPEKFRSIYFYEKKGVVKLKKNRRKVTAAEKYPNASFTPEERLKIDDLAARIEELYWCIKKWSAH